MSDLPDPSRRDAAPANNMESGQKTIHDLQWLEPPVSNQASYQEDGLAKRGVLTNMAPLGTLPRLGVFRKSPANNDFASPASRKITTKRSSAASAAVSASALPPAPPGPPTGLPMGPTGAMPMPASAAPEAATPPLPRREADSPNPTVPKSALSPPRAPPAPTPSPAASAAPAAPTPPPTFPPEDETETEEEEEDPHDGDDESEAVNRHGRITIAPPRPLGRRSLPTSRVMPEVTNWSSNGPTMPRRSQFLPRQQQQGGHPAQPLGAVQRIPFSRELVNKTIEKAVDEALAHFRYSTAFALRTLWDDFRNDNFFANMVYRISTQSADRRTMEEYGRMLRARKKQGRQQNCAYRFFGGDPHQPPHPPVRGSYDDRVKLDMSPLRPAKRAPRRSRRDPGLAPRHEQMPQENPRAQQVPVEMTHRGLHESPHAAAQEAPQETLRESAHESSQDMAWIPSQPAFQDFRHPGHFSGEKMPQRVLDPVPEDESEIDMDEGDLLTQSAEAELAQPEPEPKPAEQEIEQAADKRASPAEDQEPAPAEPAEAVQSTEPAEPAEAARPAQMAEPAGPDTSVAPAPAEPADPPKEAEPAPPANPAPPKREIQFVNAHRERPPQASPRRLRKKRRSGRMSSSGKAALPTKRHTRAHSAASTLSSLSSVRSPSPAPALKHIEEQENGNAGDAHEDQQEGQAANEEDPSEEVARGEAPAHAAAARTTPAVESKTSGSTRVGNKAPPPAAAVAAPTQSQPIAHRKRRHQHKKQHASRQSKASPAPEPSTSHVDSPAEAPAAVAAEEEQPYDMPAAVDPPLAPLFPHLATGKKKSSSAGLVFPSKVGRIDENDPKLRLRQSARKVTNLDSARPTESYSRESLMRDLPRLDFDLEPDSWRQQQQQQQQQPELGPASRHHLRSSLPASRSTPAGTPTPNPNQRSTRSSRKRSHDELEQDTGGQVSPVAPSFPASDAPSTAANSRAGTPAMRAAKRPRTGLRVKTSPMKKKTGTSAGIPRASGERSSPVGNGGTNQDGNDDYCSTCGGNGELICCDGCTRSFHIICVDPPLAGGQESMSVDWYCNACHTRRNPASLPRHSGPFAQLLERLDATISSAFRLPADVRDYFEGVRTGVDGEYEEGAPVTKHTRRRKHDEEQVPDFLRLRDADGNGVSCHLCQRGSDGYRPIIPCSLCGLHWHLDCLDPPLANPPLLRTWRCPCHIDDLLARLPGVMAPAHRRRKIKGAPTIRPAFSRGHVNNGYIEVDPEPEDRSGSRDIYSYGRAVRLPERGIKLDFLSRARVNRKGKPIPPIGVLNRPASASPAPDQGRNSLLDRHTLELQQAAHNLVQLSGQAPASGVSILLDAMLAQADESVISLMAQGNPEHLASSQNQLEQLDRQSLRAMLAQMDAMSTRIRGMLGTPAATIHDAAAAAQPQQPQPTTTSTPSQSALPPSPRPMMVPAPAAPANMTTSAPPMVSLRAPSPAASSLFAAPDGPERGATPPAATTTGSHVPIPSSNGDGLTASKSNGTGVVIADRPKKLPPPAAAEDVPAPTSTATVEEAPVSRVLKLIAAKEAAAEADLAAELKIALGPPVKGQMDDSLFGGGGGGENGGVPPYAAAVAAAAATTTTTTITTKTTAARRLEEENSTLMDKDDAMDLD